MNIEGYVIAIKGNPKSEASASRCIKSADRFGIKVHPFEAVTPKNVVSLMEDFNIPTKYFENNPYSRFENVKACFMSHYMAWHKCLASNKEIIVLEHDAVFASSLPDSMHHVGCISIGAPSYGNYHKPENIGINPLTSKKHFPGAHAYIIKPEAAKVFIETAEVEAGPADVFFHIERFPWLQEFYPWPVGAMDTFSTVQAERGCLAKHYYNESYEIIDA